MLNIVDNALHRKKMKNAGKLLELGCGAGNLALALADKGFDIYGIDISPTAILWAKEKKEEKNLKAEFKVGNVLDLPYPDNFFDVIVDGHCLHCIIGKDRKLFLHNALSTLKPNGLFIVMTMCNNPTDPEIKKDFDYDSRCLIRNGIAGRYIGLAEDILEEIKDANFNILHWEIEYANEKDPQDTIIVEATKY